MSEINKLKISEVMSRNVMVASKSNNLYQLMRFFVTNRVHHIPVVENEKVIGIISQKDLVSKIYQRLYIDNVTRDQFKESKLTATDIMTPDPITIHEDAPILKVRQILARAPFSCLPVLNDKEKLVGIVTTKDIIRTKIIHVDGSAYGGY